MQRVELKRWIGKKISESQCILSPELLCWIDEAAVQNPAKKAKLVKHQPLRDVSNQFGSCVTDGDTLTTSSNG